MQNQKKHKYLPKINYFHFATRTDMQNETIGN